MVNVDKTPLLTGYLAVIPCWSVLLWSKEITDFYFSHGQIGVLNVEFESRSVRGHKTKGRIGSGEFDVYIDAV